MNRSLSLACCLLPITWLAGCGGSEAADSGPPAYDASFLDLNADPCTDFYQYACGTWVAQHPPQSGYAQARFYAGNAREDVYFASLLREMQGSDASLSEPRRYFDACLSARRNDVATDSTLQALLQIPSSLKAFTDLPSVLAQLHAAGVSALFSAYSSIDGTDPSRYGVDLSPSGYSLSRAQYADSTLAALYRAHIEQLTRLALQRLPGGGLPLDSQAVFDLERAIAEASKGDVAQRDPVASYNPTPLSDLSATVPGFAWPAYFQARTIADTSRLSLSDPEYFTTLGTLLDEVPLETVSQYLTWRVLEAYASATSQPLIAEEFAFHGGTLLGRSNPGSDEGNCLDATRARFGFQLAHHYVTRFVSASLKPSADALVGSIRAAMQNNFDASSWLDDATRARAHEKLDLLLSKVAYPEHWPADPVLDNTGNGSFVALQLGLVQSALTGDAERVGSAVDRSDFFLSPDTANAAYRPQSNDITIALPMLQTPFYREDRPAAFDYGGLGVVVGHELTHAFDDQGRHYDGTGALSDWWSEASASSFEDRAQCLVDQYDAYEVVSGRHVNGALTLGENIADLGGTRLAYAAFEASAERRGSGSYSAEQAFFLALAQVHCSSYSPDLQGRLLDSDPHSPDALRVNGVVRNLPEFAAAFSCAAGAPLAPQDRCQVW